MDAWPYRAQQRDARATMLVDMTFDPLPPGGVGGGVERQRLLKKVRRAKKAPANGSFAYVTLPSLAKCEKLHGYLYPHGPFGPMPQLDATALLKREQLRQLRSQFLPSGL